MARPPVPREDTMMALLRDLKARVAAIAGRLVVPVGKRWRIEEDRDGNLTAVIPSTGHRILLGTPGGADCGILDTCLPDVLAAPLRYDTDARSLGLALSGAAGNTLALAADGGLYVPPPAAGGGTLSLTFGVVATTSPLTVTIDGTPVAAERIQEHSYSAGDPVWVLVSGSLRLVIGKHSPLPSLHTVAMEGYYFVSDVGWLATTSTTEGDPDIAEGTWYQVPDETTAGGSISGPANITTALYQDSLNEIVPTDYVAGFFRKVEQSTIYLPIPLAMLRAELALAWAIPPGTEMSSCTLILRLRGSSWDKNAQPGVAMPGAFPNQSYTGGTGSVRLAADATGTVTGWNAYAEVTVPAVRDRAFADGAGTVLWSGALAALPGTGSDGIDDPYADPTVVRYDLTLDQARNLDHLVVQASVSATPAPERIAYGPGPGAADGWATQRHWYRNDLQCEVQVEFTWTSL